MANKTVTRAKEKISNSSHLCGIPILQTRLGGPDQEDIKKGNQVLLFIFEQKNTNDLPNGGGTCRQIQKCIP